MVWSERLSYTGALHLRRFFIDTDYCDGIGRAVLGSWRRRAWVERLVESRHSDLEYGCVSMTKGRVRSFLICRCCSQRDMTFEGQKEFLGIPIFFCYPASIKASTGLSYTPGSRNPQPFTVPLWFKQKKGFVCIWSPRFSFPFVVINILGQCHAH